MRNQIPLFYIDVISYPSRNLTDVLFALLLHPRCLCVIICLCYILFVHDMILDKDYDKDQYVHHQSRRKQAYKDKMRSSALRIAWNTRNISTWLVYDRVQNIYSSSK